MSRRSALWVTAIAASLASGCGDVGASALDAATDGGRDAGELGADAQTLAPTGPLPPAPPAAPSEPAPPVLTPCPSGWRTRTGMPPSPDVCDPWPPLGAETCRGSGEAHFVGEPACAPVGRACPSGDWPEPLPTGRTIVYVRAGATGGDGTLGAPFGTIGEAVTAAPAGALVAVAKGRYPEQVVLGAGLALWGACAAETYIEPASGGTGGAIDVTGSGAEIRDVQLRGARMGITVRTTGASAQLDGVVIEDVASRGISVAAGAQLTGSRVVVRRIRGSGGALGIVASGGGTIELGSVVVQHTALVAVTADGAGSRVALTDVAIADTATTADGMGGTAVYAVGGGEVSVARFVIERAHDVGVFVVDVGSRATLSEGVLRDVIAASASGGARGIVAQDGGELSVSRVLLERTTDYAIVALGPGTSATVTNSIIRDIARNPGGERGHGVGAYRGASTTLSRVELTRTHDAALIAVANDARIDASDIRVTDVRGRTSDGRGGVGVVVQMGADAVLSRMVISDPSELGVFASDVGTMLEARDLVVERVRGRLILDGGNGRGIEIGPAATGTFERVVVQRAREAGVIVSGLRAIGSFQDLVVRDTERNARGIEGRASGVQYGGSLVLERALFENNAGSGIIASTDAATVQAMDVAIVAADGAGERGVSIEATATAVLERLSIEGGHEVGIASLASGSAIDATDVSIHAIHSRVADGRAGHGLVASAGASLRVMRLRVGDVREAGALAAGVSTTLELADVSIADVEPADCAMTTCPSNAYGFGLVAYLGGHLRASGFSVLRSAVAGVVVGPGGAVDLSQGEVAESPIGANVQVPSYDLARLSDRVVYRNVDRALDTTTLPVPEAVAPVGRP